MIARDELGERVGAAVWFAVMERGPSSIERPRITAAVLAELDAIVTEEGARHMMEARAIVEALNTKSVPHRPNEDF